MNPATSIVIPAHNEEQSLKRLLPELRQRHPDWEIIEYVCNENNKDVQHMIDGNP